MVGTVCTLYELRESDSVATEGMALHNRRWETEFFELDIRVFNKALGILEQNQKAKVFASNNNVGVKFL
jgi:hypothetical protein